MKAPITFVYLLLCSVLFSQVPPPPIKYGKINDQVLLSKSDSVFPNANAVVLVNYSSSQMTVLPKDLGFKTFFHKRIKLYKSSAFDLANIQIPIFNGEEITELKAQTINYI